MYLYIVRNRVDQRQSKPAESLRYFGLQRIGADRSGGWNGILHKPDTRVYHRDNDPVLGQLQQNLIRTVVCMCMTHDISRKLSYQSLDIVRVLAGVTEALQQAPGRLSQVRDIGQSRGQRKRKTNRQRCRVTLRGRTDYGALGRTVS